jgi:DNA polymerase elongation subunit (family B)
MNKDYWLAVRNSADTTERQAEYIDMSHLYTPERSHAQAAEWLNIDRRAVDRGIQSAVDKATQAGVVLDSTEDLKILSIDIETAPMMGYLWSIWREMRTPDHLSSDWYIMSYAYKWLGNDTVYGRTLRQCSNYTIGTEDDSELIEDLWNLFDEADIIVAHNGDKFDIKKIKTRMLTHIMVPPSPYRTVDTLKICKREFSFTSNRLDYVANLLLGEGKIDTGGMELWIDCIHGDDEAWKHMLDYNLRDVDILERVYKHIRSWDRSHPNIAIMTGVKEPACTVCASTELEPLDKLAATNVSLFHSYRCTCCGHVMRGRKNVRDKEAMKNGLLNAR